MNHESTKRRLNRAITENDETWGRIYPIAGLVLLGAMSLAVVSGDYGAALVFVTGAWLASIPRDRADSDPDAGGGNDA